MAPERSWCPPRRKPEPSEILQCVCLTGELPPDRFRQVHGPQAGVQLLSTRAAVAAAKGVPAPPEVARELVRSSGRECRAHGASHPPRSPRNTAAALASSLHHSCCDTGWLRPARLHEEKTLSQETKTSPSQAGVLPRSAERFSE